MIHQSSECNYEYDAFISYSHSDKKATVKLQRALERYHIPKSIQKARNNPSSALNIFRDETNLPAGSLTTTVCQALDLSKKLIVICSTTAARESSDKYKWVSQEIQYFIDTGRRDDIIPVLLDGDWSELPENIRLLQKDLYITDFTKLNYRIAFFKVLAGILEIDYDLLINRDKNNRRFRVCAMAALCITICSLWFYYFCPHTTYYSDYIIRYGKPEGIGPLTAAQRSTRSEIYAITTNRSRHEIQLKHINSSGLVSADRQEHHIESISSAVYTCLNDWQIDTVTYFDENEKQLYTYAYAPDLSYLDIIISKNDAQWLTTSAGEGEYGFPVRTNISRHRLEFDKQGLLSKRTYAVDRLDSINENGIGGERYKHDSLGRIEEIIYLNPAGETSIDKQGIAYKKFIYNDTYQLVRIEYHGSDGDLINNNLRYAAIENEYDISGNLTEIHYYDQSNAPVITSHGYAVELRGFNDNGFITSCSYFDINGLPTYGPYNFHKITIERDDKGRDTSTSYFSVSNEPILSTALYAKRDTEYNDQGLVRDQFYYDPYGQPCLNSVGSHHCHYDYDNNGNLTKISHYGLDEHLIYSKLGYAVMRLSYNERDMEKTQSYFGIDDEPILGLNGYHKQEFMYDERYNINEIHYTGILGQPALCSDGYAFRKLDYDSAGNIHKDSYFDDYKQPTLKTGSFFEAIMEYNEHGCRTSIKLMNPDGTPADNALYSQEEILYDDYGRETEKNYYHQDELISTYQHDYTNNSLIKLTPGTQRKTIHRYDDRGREIETTACDGPSQSSRIVSAFDSLGNMTRREYYDEKDELLYYFVTEYNLCGLPIKTSYYNAQGELSSKVNAAEQVAVIVSTYDNRNLRIERKCYDENNNPIRINTGGKMTYARLTTAYDKNKNCVKSVFYDEKGHVYQSILQEYDPYHRELNRVYLDGDGKQLVRKEVKYDTSGNVISVALYDRNDKLQADPYSGGVAKVLFSYDGYGYVTGQEFYDGNDNLIAPYGLYPKYEATRENGRTTQIKYYGIDGKLASNPDGYAIEKFTYDSRGNELSRAFFDSYGNPVLLKWKFSRYEVQYDQFGNLAGTKYFDATGREVEQVDGILEQDLAYIHSVPQRVLIFHGIDGSSLMGQLETKIAVPLNEFVVPENAESRSTAPATEERSTAQEPEQEQDEPHEQEDSMKFPDPPAPAFQLFQIYLSSNFAACLVPSRSGRFSTS